MAARENRVPGRASDALPWYRQFWPWFLIALPGSVVIAGLSTLYIANRHSDDLVADEYYKDGLAINVQLERQSAAADLGLAATLQILDARIQVRLKGDEAVVALTPTLQLRLSHPLEADRDFRIELRRVAPGLFDAVMPGTVSPNWHWILEDKEGVWRLDGALEAQNFLGIPTSEAEPLNPG